MGTLGRFEDFGVAGNQYAGKIGDRLTGFSHAVAERKTNRLTMPQLAFATATRLLAGVGVGMLIGRRFDNPLRRALGIAFVAIGVATTVPVGMLLFRKREI